LRGVKIVWVRQGYLAPGLQEIGKHDCEIGSNIPSNNSPAPFEVARTQLAYGEWLRGQDRREEAREELRAALAGFEATEALGFAERARRELRAAGASPRAAADRDPAELTPHELRVAQLVSHGLTNREAAAALFVSTKTVEHHLRNTFRKLGIRRRAELARLMAR